MAAGRRIGALALALIVLLAACAPGQGPWRRTPGPAAASDRDVLVTVPVDDEWLLKRLGSTLEADYPVALVAEWPLASIGEHCLVFRVDDGQDPGTITTRLANDVRVASAQPMQVYRVQGEAYDDRFLDQQESVRALNAIAAHRLATGRGVRIAIIDTGVAVDHPDLAGRIAIAQDFVGDAGGRVVAEAHGTAMAGVIAARAGNGIGIVGVAPDAEVMALRGCWEAGGTGECSSFTLARALNVAILRRADVINLSLTGPRDPLLARLIDGALERGTIVVAAAPRAKDAGGEGGFPANAPGVFSAAATAAYRPLSLAAGPRRAESPRIAPAPGVTALKAPGIDVLTTIPNDGYDFLSGNSLASAHVAAVAALVKERWPASTAADVASHLEASSHRPGGGIDACRALAGGSGDTVPVTAAAACEPDGGA